MREPERRREEQVLKQERKHLGAHDVGKENLPKGVSFGYLRLSALKPLSTYLNSIMAAEVTPCKDETCHHESMQS